MGKTVFICSFCGKETKGRVPKGGDGSFVYPARHKVNGKNCPGNIKEAKWKSYPTDKTT